MNEQHTCPVCTAPAVFHFEKEYDPVFELGKVLHVCCTGCGFTWSPTLYALSEADFARVNDLFHTRYGEGDDPSFDPDLVRRPKWATAIYSLFRAGVIPGDKPWLDFGCGAGALVSFLANHDGPDVVGYEPFMGHTAPQDVTLVKEDQLAPGKFGLVIATALLEHIRDLKQFDDICNLVAEDGCLAFHTWVSDRITSRPDWFYLRPVHCSFFSTEAMNIVMRRNGFTSATHIPMGNLNFWFRRPEAGEAQGRMADFQEDFTDERVRARLLPPTSE